MRREITVQAGDGQRSGRAVLDRALPGTRASARGLRIGAGASVEGRWLVGDRRGGSPHPPRVCLDARIPNHHAPQAMPREICKHLTNGWILFNSPSLTAPLARPTVTVSAGQAGNQSKALPDRPPPTNGVHLTSGCG